MRATMELLGNSEEDNDPKDLTVILLYEGSCCMTLLCTCFMPFSK
jgi:hypothetical protein